LLLTPLAAAGQSNVLTGRVVGPTGQPLAGVRVEEKGTLNTAITSVDGRYVLRYGSPGAVIRFSFIGYRDEERHLEGVVESLDIELSEGVLLEELLVVGSRRPNRSALNTPVAVDVIDVREATKGSGQLDLNQLLQYVAPSFNVTRQSGADGSDHIDPATLRGLGPDQTLVLINGKRRHQSSLVNIFGTRGRGNTGTDLNAIPVAAIERIEILRDGASAQYGSDAIAGVINIVLKSTVDEFSGSISAGSHNARPPSSQPVLRDKTFDGEQVQVSGNYGVRLGEYGFLNATAEYLSKERTNRPADPAKFDIYRRMSGDAAMDNFGVFLNGLVPISEATSFYAFGGTNFRHTDAYAWTREPGTADEPNPRNILAIYPNGFDPMILSDITDRSVSAGLKTELRGWNVDLNHTYGANRFHYLVDGTLNASLLEKSPTRFDAGGFDFGQNTTGVHFTRLFPGTLSGVNVAFGTEYRIDRYRIFAGEEGSYRNFGVVDTVIDGRVVQVDILGRPGGSQGFPGFQPANELDEVRTNLGAYLDAEFDLSERVMVGAAARYEDYSDFGSTLTGKLATRLTVSDALTLRASASTGFRAPSLAQIHFNNTYTDFVSGEAVDLIIAKNNSPITRALGIPKLKEEKAVNASVGFTARFGDFAATVDGYYVDIEDRIVLTGLFEDSDPDIGEDLQALNVGAAQFFTNALDTRTLGLDVVLTYARRFGEHRFSGSLAGNFNDMELGAIKTSPKLAGKEAIYFGPREKHFLLASAPLDKFSLMATHGRGRLETTARLVRFGKVTLMDWEDTEDVYFAKTTIDLTFNYRLSDNMSLSFGGANLFNVYPDHQDTETEGGGIWDAVQMGTAGAFYFAKLNFKL
jgi:iron complex outermembrane receptor protein